MLWTNLRYYGQLPFVNLSRRAQIIFALRVFTLLASLIFGVYLKCSKSKDMPLYVLESKHSDLAKGLYYALKTTSDNAKSFMTTSEILLLAKYIENHIEDTPEQVRSGINDWCALTYSDDNLDYYDASYLQDNDYQVVKDSNRHNATIVCYPNNGQPLDYAEQLSDIGLDITLSYAYNNINTKDQAPVQNADNGFVTSPQYKATMRTVNTTVQRFKAMVISTIILQTLMILLTFVYYSLRGNDMDDENISWIFKNGFAILSLTDMLVTISAFASMFIQVSRIQMDIENQLTKFGIYMKLGSTFMVVSAFWISFSVFVLTLWAGPVWCNRQTKKSSKAASNQIPLPMEAYEYDYTYVDGRVSSSQEDDEEEGDPFADNMGKKFGTVHYDYEISKKEGSSGTANNTDEDDDKEDSDTMLKETTNNIQESTRYLSMTSSQHENKFSENPFNPNLHEHHMPLPMVKNPDNNHSKIYQNSAFVRSEQLFNRRKPPTSEPLLNSPLNNNDLIPMTPIMGSNIGFSEERSPDRRY